MGDFIAKHGIVITIVFTIGFFTFVIGVIVLDSLGIKNLSLEQAHKLAKRSRENGPLLAALVIVDIVIWTFLRPQLETTFTLLTLLYITLSLNGFFLPFILGRLFATALAKKRIKELEKEKG